MLFHVSQNACPFVSVWEARPQVLEFNLFLTMCKFNSERGNMRLSWESPKKLKKSTNAMAALQIWDNLEATKMA